MPSASILLRVLVTVLALLCVLALVAWWFQRRLIYFPDNSPVPPASSVLPGAEDVRLTTADGLELGGWYVPPTAAPGRDLTVLVTNGNGGNRAGRASLAAALARDGFAVLLFDYRGYGGNPGTPTSTGLGLDARAAHRFLTRDKGIRPSRLLYFGESLGTAVAADLALEHPPAGLLLRSPFTDLESLARRMFFGLPVGFLLRDRFAVADAVSRVDVPTTVVYGTADDIVPPEQSRAVAAAARGPVDVVALDGAGHNDAVMFGDVVAGAVAALADRIDPQE